MKKTSNQLIAVLALGVLLSACQKDFDPSSYAPKLNIGGYTAASEVAAANLVAHWGFEGSFKEAVSGDAGAATGSVLSSGLKMSGMANSGESYVVYNTPSGVQSLKSFTVALWVKANQNTTGIAGLFDIANPNSFWGNLTIFFENGATADVAKLKIHVNNNGVDAWLGNYDLNKIWGQWTHLSVTYDAGSSTFKVYSNGSNIATQVVAGYGPVTFQTPGKMVLGTVHFQTVPSLSNHGKEPWASYLNGSLDEVRVYNKALTSDEINSLLTLEGKGK
ncbi:MAG TPA: LamG domain-containing protein [Phnomibacter sp.]|nr:LamG domain-containing protein [Phnomibacter sp.]